MRSKARAAALVLAGLALGLAGAVRAGDTTVRDLPLKSPFDARTDWRLTITQGPEIRDPVFDEGMVPGALRLCLGSPPEPCAQPLDGLPDAGRPADSPYVLAHVLEEARVVWPNGERAPPLLWLRTASLSGANGDRIEYTQLLAYRRGADRFTAAFSEATGRNNNQEIRYILAGPLRGAVVSAEPTANAPFGFWITVNRLDAAYVYKSVLRYRSATRYGDGNPLAVIDSEMPNIQRRLGLWRAGAPLPLPAARCPHPRLERMELWCD